MLRQLGYIFESKKAVLASLEQHDYGRLARSSQEHVLSEAYQQRALPSAHNGRRYCGVHWPSNGMYCRTRLQKKMELHDTYFSAAWLNSSFVACPRRVYDQVAIPTTTAVCSLQSYYTFQHRCVKIHCVASGQVKSTLFDQNHATLLQYDPRTCTPRSLQTTLSLDFTVPRTTLCLWLLALASKTSMRLGSMWNWRHRHSLVSTRAQHSATPLTHHLNRPSTWRRLH